MTKEDGKVLGIDGNERQSRIQIARDQQTCVCKIDPASRVTQELLAHGLEVFGDEMLTGQELLIQPAEETLDRLAPCAL
jgi:hypothetical protein